MNATKLFVAVFALSLLAGCGGMTKTGSEPSDFRWLKDQNGQDVCEYGGRILPKAECLKIIGPAGEKALAEKSEPGPVRTVLCFENIFGAVFGWVVDPRHNGSGSMGARVINPGGGPKGVSPDDCSPTVARPTVFDKSDPYDEWGERYRRLEQSYK